MKYINNGIYNAIKCESLDDVDDAKSILSEEAAKQGKYIKEFKIESREDYYGEHTYVMAIIKHPKEHTYPTRRPKLTGSPDSPKTLVGPTVEEAFSIYETTSKD